MRRFFKKAGRALKKVAKVALPVAAIAAPFLIPGAGAALAGLAKKGLIGAKAAALKVGAAAKGALLGKGAAAAVGAAAAPAAKIGLLGKLAAAAPLVGAVGTIVGARQARKEAAFQKELAREQLNWEKEQFERLEPAKQQQWQAEFDLRQKEADRQTQQWQQQFEHAKKIDEAKLSLEQKQLALQEVMQGRQLDEAIRSAKVREELEAGRLRLEELTAKERMELERGQQLFQQRRAIAQAQTAREQFGAPLLPAEPEIGAAEQAARGVLTGRLPVGLEAQLARVGEQTLAGLQQRGILTSGVALPEVLRAQTEQLLYPAYERAMETVARAEEARAGRALGRGELELARRRALVEAAVGAPTIPAAAQPITAQPMVTQPALPTPTPPAAISAQQPAAQQITIPQPTTPIYQDELRKQGGGYYG